MAASDLLRAPTKALVWLTTLVTRLRHNPPAERTALLQLIALSLVLLVAGLVIGPEGLSPGTQAIPLLLGGLLLQRAGMRQLSAVVLVCLVGELVVSGLSIVRPGDLLVVLLTGLVAYEFCRAREETGLHGTSGELFVVGLRDRILKQGQLPPLPAGWHGETVLRPAGDGPFAGDVIVSSLTAGGRCLELVLVDVSGKGVDAGTRSLLLSGALGGLLGAVDPSRLLPSANDYLDRQQWEDGFATGVHLLIDLDSGEFQIESAGHPPVAHFAAGSGRWSLLRAEGMALGLVPDVAYTPESGRLQRGDALLLYTDGLVEVPGRDLSVGIDRLLGEADRAMTQGFAGAGERLVSRVADEIDDDRGLVLIWRS